jgi:hypothetical protein
MTSRSPFRLLSRVLHRIPWRGARPAVRALLLFGVSLAIGRACEVAFSKETLASAFSMQARWMAVVGSMSPLALGTGYLDDLGHALRGEILYRPTPRATTAGEINGPRAASQRLACAIALSQPNGWADSPSCAALGVTNAAALAVLEREAANAAANERRTALTATHSSGSTSSARSIPVFLTPLAAVVRTATRVAAGGVLPLLLVIFQLGLGLLGVLTVNRLRPAGRSSGDGLSLGGFFMLPLAVVAMGSALAWALHGLMTGALFTLQWMTSLAAAAAGAGGAMGFCWYCFAKLSEKTVEGAVMGKS